MLVSILKNILGILKKIWRLFLKRALFVMPVSEVEPFAAKAQALIQEFKNYLAVLDRLPPFPEYSHWLENVLAFQDKWESASKKLTVSDKYLRSIQELFLLRESAKEARYSAIRVYLDLEISRHDGFFNGLKRPLDVEQKRAVVCDAFRTLVLAGAGSGKTEVIATRCSYLIREKSVSPSKIRLLTLTRKAADNMRERLKRLGVSGVDVSTIHSLAMRISQGLGLGKAMLLDPEGMSNNSRRGVLLNVFKRLVEDDPDFSDMVMEYQMMYQEVPEDHNSFQTREEWETYVQSWKPDMQKSSGKRENNIRLKTKSNDLVRSYEEKVICDLLYQWGISFKYEQSYEVDTADATHRQYFPDFYFPEHGVYLEHYGVNRNFEPPPWFMEEEKRRYKERMDWKEKIHEENGTKIIHTYSFQLREGTLRQELLKQLAQFGIKPKKEKLDFRSFLKDDMRMPRINETIGNFLSLYKVGNYGLDQIERDAVSPGERMFVRIFDKFSKAYEAKVEEMRRKDFDDLIRDAIRELDARGRMPDGMEYEHLIVDEFQDTGRGTMLLIESILKASRNCSLYCVGDDWQSIYSFAGSHVSEVTDFEEKYKGAVVVQMATNYRSNINIVELGKQWMDRGGSSVLPKAVRSHRTEIMGNAVLRIGGCRNKIREILLKEPDATFFFLGRYTGDTSLGWIKMESKLAAKDQIECLSIHKSKGLEKDYVFILPPQKHGFPTRLTDEDVFRLVRPLEQGYREGEERRLMYVALTRAKKQVFFLEPDKSNVPTFLNELRPLVRSVNDVLRSQSKG